MEQDKAIMYYCDPEKNTECRKIGCAHTMTLEEGGVCFITMQREYARTDENGDPVIYNRERCRELIWQKVTHEYPLIK